MSENGLKLSGELSEYADRSLKMGTTIFKVYNASHFEKRNQLFHIVIVYYMSLYSVEKNC